MVVIKDDIERIIPELVTQWRSKKVLIVLIAVIVCLLIIVIGLAASFTAAGATASFTDFLCHSASKCSTKSCLHTAAWISDNVDSSTRPCDNFYQFSCGSWLNSHSLPPDEQQLTVTGIIEDQVDEKLRELIENRPVTSSPVTSRATSAEQKLRYFFQSCIHDYGRQKDAGSSLVEMLRTGVGSWYVLDPVSWRSSWNFQQALVNVHSRLLVDVFFATYISRDRLTGNNILALYSSGLGLPATHYSNDKKQTVQDAYKDYMRSVATLLLRDANVTVNDAERRERVDQFVDDAYRQEHQLALLSKQVRDSGSYYRSTRTTIAQLSNNFTQLNWQAVIGGMFDDVSVTSDSPIILWSPTYFSLVNEMLLNESQSDNKDRMLNNYLTWRIMFKYARELSWEYRQAGYRYQELSTGVKEWPSTWKSCVEAVKSRLGSVLAAMFIKTHLTSDVRQQVNEMFSNIRAALVQRISELPWMDAVTQSRAVEKVNAVKCVIGFSDMYYNDTLIQLMHESLEIDSTATYLQNIIKVNVFQRQMRIKLFHGDQESFMDHLPLLGTTFQYWTRIYYQWFSNLLLIPAGIITEPIYSTGRSQVINYALLGTQLAGQLVNSIAQQGRYTWTNGSSANWWTNATAQEYNKIKLCFDGYFDGLTAGPFSINGTNFTVPVNGRYATYRYLDDMAGIRLALTAYRNSLQVSDDKLPVGLAMSTEQLYFTALAQTKCYLRTSTAAMRSAKYNVLPEDLELNSLLSHSTEFTEAFSCPVGSPMKYFYQCNIF